MKIVVVNTEARQSETDRSGAKVRHVADAVMSGMRDALEGHLVAPGRKDVTDLDKPLAAFFGRRS